MVDKKTKGFLMPKPMKITGRTSSITNAAVNGIIPSITPKQCEIDEALNILGMTSDTVRCAYCGDTATEWDHLFPLIEDKKPTGHITEIANLVPCCSKCNQSKGNRYWRDWFYSDANLSPKTKGVGDLNEKYNKLDEYEKTYSRTVLDIKEIIGEEKWAEYMENIEKIRQMMYDTQKLSDEIKQNLENQYKKLKNGEAYEGAFEINKLDIQETTLETLLSTFTNKVSGGWGYSREDAVAIVLNDDGKVELLENRFMECRFNLEMKKCGLHGVKLYGFRVDSKAREQVIGNEGKTYDKITMVVTIYLKVQEQVMHFEHVEEGWFSISSSSSN